MCAPMSELQSNISTAFPRSSAPFYIVSYNIKRVTTSWTYSTMILPDTTETTGALYSNLKPLNIDEVALDKELAKKLNAVR